MLVASIILTLTGLVATLWHVSWWIGVGFCLMVGFSFGITILAIAGSNSPDWREKEKQKAPGLNEITSKVNKTIQH